MFDPRANVATHRGVPEGGMAGSRRLRGHSALPCVQPRAARRLADCMSGSRSDLNAGLAASQQATDARLQPESLCTPAHHMTRCCVRAVRTKPLRGRDLRPIQVATGTSRERSVTGGPE